MNNLKPPKAIFLSLLAALLLLIGLNYQAWAADAQSQLTVIIDEQGSTNVVDRWSGMEMESGVFNYFSATRELGVIPVTVKNGGFTIAFKTQSYLRFEDGLYYFVTPDFYYDEGPLDVELSLTIPPNLKLLEADPAPSYTGEGVYHWSLADCRHQVVIARFERTGPFVQAGAVGPGFQVDPAVLEQMTAEELPTNADEVLKELETIITLAKAADATDPDLLKVMDKLLAKFYYLFSASGMLQDYRLPGAKARPVINATMEGPYVGDGILEAEADAAAGKQP